MSRKTSDEFNRSAGIIRNLSLGVEGMVSAFSFRVLDLAPRGNIDSQRLSQAFRQPGEELAMQRDVVVTIDFDDQRKPVDVAREIAALDAGGADRSAVLMEVIAPLSADEEVSVSPDGSAKQDQTHFQEPGSLDD